MDIVEIASNLQFYKMEVHIRVFILISTIFKEKTMKKILLKSVSNLNSVKVLHNSWLSDFIFNTFLG